MVNGDREAEVRGCARGPGGARCVSTHGALVARPAAPAFGQGANRSQLGGLDAAVAAGNRLAAKPRAFGVRYAGDFLRRVATKRPRGASGHHRGGYQPLRLSHTRQGPCCRAGTRLCRRAERGGRGSVSRPAHAAGQRGVTSHPAGARQSLLGVQVARRRQYRHSAAAGAPRHRPRGASRPRDGCRWRNAPRPAIGCR